MIRRQLRRYYKYLLSRVVFRQVVSDSYWGETCQRIRFDNFGESVTLLFRFMFFKSDVYLGHNLLGFFYGRSCGFFGATNYVCRIGCERIKFKNVSGGVRATNVKTNETLLLKEPQHRFVSRITGKFLAVLEDGSEMTVHFPGVMCFSQTGLPTYVRFIFANDVAIRCLLYGRGGFNKAINPDDVEKLCLVQPHISKSMLFAMAMYSRMYMATRWLIG